ncbi:MAG: SAM-dependent methyltransferase [Gammaproteobacteria bacterium]|nr:MAG: SAM-dependent methyltransferase [Gammaproteobacteria bacterium]RLA24514.1 MAG: SAM-dependent methyltransferase [Gammaproteobacteria bacterium]
MANQTINLSRQLHQYLLENSLREPAVMKRLRDKTAKLPECNMQIAPEQGQFMQLLVHLMGAKRVLEVGTFTGYSALAMALALPDEGELICCDLNSEWAAIGRDFWEEAGVDKKITFLEGDARRSLAGLLESGGENSIDLAFIDADKENYQNYFEQCLLLVRKGGLILIDNTLWNGAVCDLNNQSPATRSIREFNRKIVTDERILLSQLPLGDGLTMALKK